MRLIASVLIAAAAAANELTFDFAGAHYGNPFNGPCLSDEVKLTYKAGGEICSTQCKKNADCPTDEPAGMTGHPECFHSQGGHKYCVVMCKSDTECGPGGKCDQEGTTSECSYHSGSGPTPPPAPPAPTPPAPAPTPASPTPPPAPGPHTHYGDPFKGPCQTGEVNITITGVAGSTCSPACEGITKKCPADKPAGDTATPTCALKDTAGKQYCILLCSPTALILDQKAADAQCGTDASCKPIQGKGLCTYDDGAPTPPPTPPAPAAPTPPPAPTPPGTVPKISLQYTADVVSKTTGDIPGLPKGTKAYKEYYDFANKRRRLDFTGQSMSKIYRYDVTDFGHNPFPAPRGYQLNPANPNLGCCWLWLVDTSDPSNSTNLKMEQVQIPPKAKDEGSVTINGVTAEYWHAKGGIVVLESQSDWYIGNGNSLVQMNSQFRLKLKDAIANVTYTNYDTSMIDESIFAVPKCDCQECKPSEIGQCKEFGQDPECDMADYDATGDDVYMAHIRAMQMMN